MGREIFRARASWLSILLICLIHVCLRYSWYVTYGLSLKGLAAGNLWQPFTYGLLHGGWWHVVMNSVFILLIGSRIEWITSRRIFAKTLILGILFGGISHLILSPRGGILVGISGGCMSLLLLLTTLSPQSRMMPIPLSGKNLGRAVLFTTLILSLANPSLDLPGFAKLGRVLVTLGLGEIFKMGHACHLGGGIAGWLMGRWILRPRVSLEALRNDRSQREIG